VYANGLMERLGKWPLGTSTWLSKHNIKIDVRREAVTWKWIIAAFCFIGTLEKVGDVTDHH